MKILYLQKDYGKFRPGQIDKILETEEGTFVLGGTANYNNTQLDGLLFGDTLSLMWIMVVDENGIEGERVWRWCICMQK